MLLLLLLLALHWRPTTTRREEEEAFVTRSFSKFLFLWAGSMPLLLLLPSLHSTALFSRRHTVAASAAPAVGVAVIAALMYLSFGGHAIRTTIADIACRLYVAILVFSLVEWH